MDDLVSENLLFLSTKSDDNNNNNRNTKKRVKYLQRSQ